MQNWNYTAMTKAADMARTSVKGGFQYLWGLVASTVISAVGTIIIAGLLGEANYGLYVISVTAPALIALFRDWGVNTAITRYVAQYNVENKTSEIRRVFTSGLVFETTLGVLLSLVCFALSDFLAVSVFQRPIIAPLIQIASLTILTGGLINTATAAFVGIEKTHLNSVMLVAQSVAKTVLAPALIFVGLGTVGAAVAHTAAGVIAGLTGVLMIWMVHRSLRDSDGGVKVGIWSSTKVMVKYGLPLSVGAILSGLLLQYYTFLMAIYVPDNVVIGNYAIAQNFVVLITFFSMPVMTMMLPAFSKLDAKKDRETLQSVFQYSVKYASLLVVPFAMMVVAVSQPAISTLFGTSYVQAPLFLALLSVTYVFTVLGSLSNRNLINSQGQTHFNMVLSVITTVIGFVLGFVLISTLGVLGLIVTALVAGVPSLLVSLVYVKRRYNVTIDWKSSAKILLSSLAAAALTYVVVGQVGFFSNVVRLIFGVDVFAVACVFAIVLTRTLDRADISNLRAMSSSLGPLRVFNIVLNMIEKLLMKVKFEKENSSKQKT
jgi:O-antigen/teichoic acid export membrane protein